MPKHIYLNNSICDILKWIPSPTTPPPFYCTIPPDLTQKRERQNVMTNLFRREKHKFSLSLLISDLIPRRKWQVEEKNANGNWFPFGINKFSNIKRQLFSAKKTISCHYHQFLLHFCSPLFVNHITKYDEEQNKRRNLCVI